MSDDATLAEPKMATNWQVEGETFSRYEVDESGRRSELPVVTVHYVWDDSTEWAFSSRLGLLSPRYTSAWHARKGADKALAKLGYQLQ